jgi:hypothetical protein
MRRHTLAASWVPAVSAGARPWTANRAENCPDTRARAWLRPRQDGPEKSSSERTIQRRMSRQPFL